MNLLDAFSAGLSSGHASAPPDLQRRRPWDRFGGPNEAAYQRWATTRIRHLSLVTAVATLPTWVLLSFLSRFVFGVRVPWSMFVLTAVLIPLVLIAWIGLLQHGRTRQLAGVWAAVVEASVGLALLVGLREFYGFTLTGAEVYVPIMFAAFMGGMLVPFRSGLLGFLAMIAAGAFYLAKDLNNGDIAVGQAVPAFAILAGSVYTIGILFLAVEVALRNVWAQEQVIERQQAQLEVSRGLIARYVPPDVVQHIAEGKGETLTVPERRRVTMLFADVVGFTDLADQLDPESLTEVISGYLDKMADVINAHGGTLTEFAGDGFLSIFGAPAQLDPARQVSAAVAAGREILGRLPDLNEQWSRIGVHDPLRTRIGINSGVVSVGSFGSEGRATYTAMGLQTNIAARIQAHCEPGEILLSANSFALLDDPATAALKGEVSVKGVHFPLKVYSVVAAG